MDSVKVESTCRVCLEEVSDSISLFGMNDSQLITKIMACAAVQINMNDELPSQICPPCCDKLETAFTFKTVCENSDSKLRQLLKKSIVIEENKECIKLEVTSSPFVLLDNIKEEFTFYDEHDDDIKYESEDEFLINKVTKSKCITTEVKHKDATKKTSKKKNKEKEKKGSNRKTKAYDGYSLDKCEVKLKRAKKIPKDSESLLCTFCKKYFLSPSMLAIHVRVHTGERPYSCSYCNKAFASKSTQQGHERIHTGEKPFVCQECGKSFAHRSHLVTHQRIHSGLRPYKCKHCSKTYAQVGLYNEHLRVHTGERPFVCSVCGKSFARKNNFLSHSRIHTGEKLHKCDACSKSFCSATNLKAHQRIHTGEKPYECEFCKKRFTQMDHLTNHKNRHMNFRPFKCQLCDKSFPSRSNLARHRLVHLANKTPKLESQCDICQKWVVSLKDHLHIHEEKREKSITCNYCDKTFFWRHGLTRHIKRKHPAFIQRSNGVKDVTQTLNVGENKINTSLVEVHDNDGNLSS